MTKTATCALDLPAMKIATVLLALVQWDCVLVAVIVCMELTVLEHPVLLIMDVNQIRVWMDTV